MLEIRPPAPFHELRGPKLFLAGTIDQGRGERWQADVVGQLADDPGVILNPRRDEWDPAWVATLADRRFREQVSWELDALAAADVVLLHLVAGSQSPVSLLELGLRMHAGGLHVVCPAGFWRHANVWITCERHGVPCYEVLAHGIAAVRAELHRVEERNRKNEPS